MFHFISGTHLYQLLGLGLRVLVKLSNCLILKCNNEKTLLCRRKQKNLKIIIMNDSLLVIMGTKSPLMFIFVTIKIQWDYNLQRIYHKSRLHYGYQNGISALLNGKFDTVFEILISNLKLCSSTLRRLECISFLLKIGDFQVYQCKLGVSLFFINGI